MARKPLMPKLNGVRLKPGQKLTRNEGQQVYIALKIRAEKLSPKKPGYHLSQVFIPCRFDLNVEDGVNGQLINHLPLPVGFKLKEKMRIGMWDLWHYHYIPCCSYVGDEVVICLREYDKHWIIEYHKIGDCPGKE